MSNSCLAAITAIVTACAISTTAAAQSPTSPPPARSDWMVNLGLGAMIGSEYLGSDDIEAKALPQLGIDWKDLIYLDTFKGLGVNIQKDKHSEFGLAIAYDFGRDNDGDLSGMEEIEAGAVAKTYGSYAFDHWKFGFKTETFLGDTEGSTLNLYADVGSRFENSIIVTAGPGITFGTGSYMDTFFGVSAAEAGRTNFAAYDPGAGIVSYDLHGAVVLPFDKNWAMTSFGKYGVLASDAADSPIVKDDTFFQVGLTIGYKFGL